MITKFARLEFALFTKASNAHFLRDHHFYHEEHANIRIYRGHCGAF